MLKRLIAAITGRAALEEQLLKAEETLEEIAFRLRGDWWEPAVDAAATKEEEDLVYEHADFADEQLAKPLLKLICGRLGHKPVPDMCGKPEHDFCWRCQELTPGEAR